MVLIPDEPFTIDGTRKEGEEFEKKLKEICPCPGETRLLELNKEYTNPELRDLLQRYGSYLASLRYNQAKLEAECNMLKKALKTGMSVAMMESKPEGNSLTEKEASILSSNEALKYGRKMEIKNEYYLDIINGWVDAYNDAYTAVSRIVSLQLADANLATERHN